MKLYCVQLDIVWENKPANFDRAQKLIAAQSPAAGSLVLLPEMFATGFSMNASAIQEKPGGETDQFLSSVATKFGVFLGGGVVANLDGSPQNQFVVFDPDGKEIGRYSKIQPFTPGGESQHYAAGIRPISFRWRDLIVSPFVCYDLRFPEHFRQAVNLGAHLMTVIANWPVGRIQHWVTLLQARAIENQCYVAGVNRCGSDPKLTYSGRSLIVSPKGEILADAGDGERVICASIDPEELAVYRRDLPFLADMRIKQI